MTEQYVLRTTDGKEFPITGVVSIGREPTNTIALNDPSLSRHHAAVKVESGSLVIVDNNSANGVIVNDRKIPADKPKALRNGDRILIGKTELVVSVARVGESGTMILPPPPQPNRMPIMMGMGLAMLVCVLVIVVPVAGYYVFRQSSNLPPTVPPSAIAQVATSVPLSTFTPLPALFTGNPTIISNATPAVIEPGRYASQSEQLARAVADLNRSELEFMGMANATSQSGPGGVLAKLLFAPGTDDYTDKLAEIAANGLQVAAIADDLSTTTASQDGASDTAIAIASQYTSIAQVSAALVIEAQGLRDQLSKGQITVQDAAQVIAEYGTRLWNPTVATDPATTTNLFSAQVADPNSVSKPNSIEAEDVSALLGAGAADVWLASDGLSKTVTLPIPPSSAPPVDRNDPAVIQALTTAEGQKANPSAAVQVAGSIIQKGDGGTPGGDPSTGDTVTANFHGSTVVTNPNDPTTPSRNMPAFPNGKAVVISKSGEGDPVTTLLGVTGDNTPTVEGHVAVTETKPIVTITISNINITQVNKRPKDAFNTFEADVVYEFDVQWQAANLKSPQFSLDCVSGNHFDVTTPGGIVRINAKGLLILYPGSEDAFCYASRNGNTIGSASVHFLVGDAAEATQRAIQVETDSVGFDLTLTADALGTLNAAATNSAATLAVAGTSNAVSTEVIGTRTAEFQATITQIARQTSAAGPAQATLTPTATATFVPVLLETFFHPGDVFATASTVVLQPGHLYRVCLSGTVFLVNPDKAVAANEIMHINGAGVPVSGCMVIEGNGQIVSITCGEGTPAEDPGGYTVTVTDLGPR